MISAKSIDLEKFVVYDKARYEFTDGVTIIRGPNRSGKSLMFSALGNLIYGSPPVMNAKRAAKQMHVRSGSKVAFEFKTNGQVIQIVQGIQGQSVKYSVIVDGEDQATHRQADAQAMIRELIPSPEDLFYSTVYITSNRNNPLHIGTGVERLRYLESMFDFQSFDHLKIKLSELLKHSSKAVSEAEALKAELASLPTGSYLSESALLNLGISVRKISSEAASSKRAEKAKGSIESLLKVPGAEKPLEELTKDRLVNIAALEKAQSNILKFKKKAEDYRHSMAVVNNRERLEIKLVGLQTKLGIGSDDPLPKLKDCKRAVAKVMSVLDATAKEFENSKKCAEDLKAIKLIFRKRPDGVPTAEEFYRDPHDYISTFRHMARETATLQSLEGEAECPTCHRPLDAKHIRAALKEAEKAKPVVKYLESAAKLTYDPKSASIVDERKAAVLKLKDELRAASDVLDAVSEANTVKNKIKRIKIPKDLDPEAETEFKRHTAAERGIRDKLKIIDRAIEARREIDELTALAEQKPSVTQENANTLIATYAEIKSESKLLNKSEKRRRQIERRLKELGKAVEFEDILSALTEAYGPRGLRVDQMNSIARVLESSFNQFAPSIFPEPIYFSFGVQASRADLTVERNALASSDASLISGSEIHCFQALCFAALSPNIPERYRFDCVVLDELESKMDPVTRRWFVTKTIPLIQESVRSLTIVTPLPEDEFYIEGARTVNVIKEKSRSRLEVIR
jgi:recombinational DNA repair ATPase RecF